MLINKRLLGLVTDSKKHIIQLVAMNWFNLICNIIIVFSIGAMLHSVFVLEESLAQRFSIFVVALVAVLGRFVSTIMIARLSARVSSQARNDLREKIYQKILDFGSNYSERISTADVIQVSVDGIEQLEIYFSRYLPQLFYSMLAPLTLFITISLISVKAALVLLISVPLIPISIILIQKLAKRVLKNYWGVYSNLSEDFLENLQGLNLLKAYQQDQAKHQQMNERAEQFRIATMKVLTMQLNSITVMDVIAFVGSAIGIIVGLDQLIAGQISLIGAFIIIVLSAEFFIPLRLLGSFFHVAMIGTASMEKMFKVLDLESNDEDKELFAGESTAIHLRQVNFSYDGSRSILRDINMEIPEKSYIAFVGESGSGKSTIASLLMGYKQGYEGAITLGNQLLSCLNQKEINGVLTTVSYNSYLFSGTLKENLMMAKVDASDEQLWEVLNMVKLASFVQETKEGLDYQLTEGAGNLSGGQRQRLALARAILRDSAVYIFDEATSNIDVDSEEAIMEVVHQLAKEKTVIVISHRLENTVNADKIYVLNQGTIGEQGTHKELLAQQGIYKRLYQQQKALGQTLQEVG